MFAAIPLLLLTIGVGYFVALKATEEIGFLKQLGNAIAGILMVGSMLGILWLGYIYFASGCFTHSLKCPFEKPALQEQVK